MRGLLHEERTTFEGEFFTLTDAAVRARSRCRRALPIWIGGGGEKRTLRIAAQLRRRVERAVHRARGVRAQGAVLHRHCDDVGRDPAEIRCAVNVGLAWRDEDFEAQFGNMRMMVRPGVLMGSDAEVVDRVGEYVDAGADQVNVAIRAPFDADGLERLTSAVGIGSG